MKLCCETGREIKTEVDKLSCGHDHCTGAVEVKTIQIDISSPSEQSTYTVQTNSDKEIVKVGYRGYSNGGGAGVVGEILIKNIPVHVRKAVEIMLEIV